MAEADPNGSIADTGYRLGYRHGFGDGFGEAQQLRDQKHGEQADAEKKTGENKDQDDNKDDDAKDGDKAGDGKKNDADEKDAKPLYKRPLIVAIALAVVLTLIIVAIIFWRHSRHHEKTDDAFIDGNASMVAAQAAGRVTKLLVNDNQMVHAGDSLLEIDDRDTEARAEQSRAQLADAQSQLASANAQVEVRRATTQQAAAQTRQALAELAKAERDLGRFRRVDPDAVPRQQVDAATAAAQSARAQLDAARSTERSARAQTSAALAQVRSAEASILAARAGITAAELQVGYARVVAPVDGRVTRRQVELGNVISVGQPLLAIIGNALWVTANYKETQLTKMRPGQAVEVTVDAYPDAHFRAHVDSIQRGTGAYFSMLPAENATGNYVKVVQRVPVKIVFDDDEVLRYAIGPGMSVAPDVTIP